MSSNDSDKDSPIAAPDFATTHWTVVLKAGGGEGSETRTAIRQLCEEYWYPLYVFVRRRTADVHDAQDLTQAFFAHLLESGFVAAADPDRGRFRAFLLTACKRFLINEWHKARTAKCGGGQTHLSLDFDSGESRLSLIAADSRTAEQLYDEQWALTLLERVLQRLEAGYTAKNKQLSFEALKPFLAGAPANGGHAAAARSLGVTEGAFKVAAHRLRTRYRELLRAEIAQTVERPEEIDDEIRDLFAALGAEKRGNSL